MTQRLAIIGRTMPQARAYARKLNLALNEWFFVYSERDLMGMRNIKYVRLEGCRSSKFYIQIMQRIHAMESCQDAYEVLPEVMQ